MVMGIHFGGVHHDWQGLSRARKKILNVQLCNGSKARRTVVHEANDYLDVFNYEDDDDCSDMLEAVVH